MMTVLKKPYRTLCRAGVAAILIAATASANAQQYPNRPIRVISPYPAGSASDTVTRVVLDQVSQQALRFYKRVGYHRYEGITEDFDERARINKDLGQNRALIMQHHGLLTVGKTAREAFVLMKYLLTAAEIQLKMEATGGELLEVPPEVCAKTAEQFEHHDSGRGLADWSAYLRLLDGIDKSYRE